MKSPHAHPPAALGADHTAGAVNADLGRPSSRRSTADASRSCGIRASLVAGLVSPTSTRSKHVQPGADRSTR
jgi:hypothetical protein